VTESKAKQAAKKFARWEPVEAFFYDKWERGTYWKHAGRNAHVVRLWHQRWIEDASGARVWKHGPWTIETQCFTFETKHVKKLKP
jgi:hypothetical protein